MSKYCSDCLRGGKAVGDPKGKMVTLHNIPTYIASRGSASSTTSSQSTIIFLTDGFGMRLANNKLLADAYASATGFRVLVPDLLPDSGLNPRVLELMDALGAPVPWWNIPGQLGRIWNWMQVFRYFIPFFFRVQGEKAAPGIASYARKIKAELPAGAKLGAAGFCWGGLQSVLLCGYPAAEGGKESLLDAQFCAHPSAIKVPESVVDAITKYKIPFSWAHGKDDYMMPTNKVEECEAILRKQVGEGDVDNEINYEIKYYTGCGHGFGIRSKPGSKEEEDGADRAKEQAIDWFKKYL